MSPMDTAPAKPTLLVFNTQLGWMAVSVAAAVVRDLKFGYRSAAAAAAAVPGGLRPAKPRGPWQTSLVRRLRDFARGIPVSFHDIAVDPGPQTPFRQRVIRQCQAIPYGETVTYGKLAAGAGSPSAARAVGSAMAANRVPLLIPCHRVVPASGGPGSFSAPGGCRMKRRLLELEAGPGSGNLAQLG